MLKMISCNKFKNNAKVITFHNGLNIVKGDGEKSNSIGKSTLLMIIDFCFGGRDYPKVENKTISFVGDHNIDFVFEFRNSVEHWYPQHPSSQSFDSWADVDKFGNLCIIQRNVNSKFSNLSPASKKDTYRQMIEKGSLKLRLMSSITEDDAEWKETICGKHEEAMLKLLKNACNMA